MTVEEEEDDDDDDGASKDEPAFICGTAPVEVVSGLPRAGISEAGGCVDGAGEGAFTIE